MLPPHKGDGRRLRCAKSERSICRCSLMGSGITNFLSQGLCSVAPQRAQSRAAMLYRVELEHSLESLSKFWNRPRLLWGAYPSLWGTPRGHLDLPFGLEHWLSLDACMLSCFSCVRLFGSLWTVACQAPLSMGFSRQEYWSGLPCPPPGDLPHPGVEPMSSMSPACGGGFFTTSATRGSYQIPK